MTNKFNLFKKNKINKIKKNLNKIKKKKNKNKAEKMEIYYIKFCINLHPNNWLVYKYLLLKILNILLIIYI